MGNETPRGGLLWISAAIFVLAIAVWKFRKPQPATPKPIAQTTSSQPQGLSEQQARDLLEHTFQADETQSYTALINSEVFMSGRWYKSEAQISKAPGAMTLSYINGEGNGLQYGYNQNWSWRKPSPTAPLQPYAHLDKKESHLQVLLHNYKVSWRGMAQFEDHTTDVLEITPRYPMQGGGPAKRIWVDRTSRLPIRIETFNYHLVPVMRSSMTKLQIVPEIAPASFVSDTTIQQALQQTPWTAYQLGENFEEAGKIAGIYPPLPTYLPAGFIREGVGVYRCSPQDDSCYAASSRYTDGINSLTLFALKPECAQLMQITPSPSQTQQNADGQVSAFGPGTVSTRSSNDGTLIAVADFPPTELLRVLNSIQIRLYSVTHELNGIPNTASTE